MTLIDWRKYHLHIPSSAIATIPTTIFVMARIIESWYAHPRDVFLFFYYPADDFLSYLMTVDELEFYDEIECEDLFSGNDPRERILIFQLPDYESEW